MGVPLANKVIELKARPQRVVTVIEITCASFNNGLDFLVIICLMEDGHPKTIEHWHEVRTLVSDFTDRLRSRLPCGAQVSSCPDTVASFVGNVRAACSTSCSAA
jgi:hypothetical protein